MNKLKKKLLIPLSNCHSEMHQLGLGDKGPQIQSSMIQNWIPTNVNNDYKTIWILRSKFYIQF